MQTKNYKRTIFSFRATVTAFNFLVSLTNSMFFHSCLIEVQSKKVKRKEKERRKESKEITTKSTQEAKTKGVKNTDEYIRMRMSKKKIKVMAMIIIDKSSK